MVRTGLPNQPEAETALAFATAAAATAVDAALETEDFAAAMTALAALRAPVDAFFTGVMVNSDVAAERDNRLKLLGQVRDGHGSGRRLRPDRGLNFLLPLREKVARGARRMRGHADV
jgi:hypothetical protein